MVALSAGSFAAGGRATLTFPVTVASGASLASSPAPLTEANLDGATLTLAPGTTVRTFAVSATARRSPTRRSWCDCALP